MAPLTPRLKILSGGCPSPPSRSVVLVPPVVLIVEVPLSATLAFFGSDTVFFFLPRPTLRSTRTCPKPVCGPSAVDCLALTLFPLPPLASCHPNFTPSSFFFCPFPHVLCCEIARLLHKTHLHPPSSLPPPPSCGPSFRKHGGGL